MHNIPKMFNIPNCTIFPKCSISQNCLIFPKCSISQNVQYPKIYNIHKMYKKNPKCMIPKIYIQKPSRKYLLNTNPVKSGYKSLLRIRKIRIKTSVTEQCVCVCVLETCLEVLDCKSNVKFKSRNAYFQFQLEVEK